MGKDSSIDTNDATAVLGADRERACALLGPALLAMAADGATRESERRKLGNLLTANPLFLRIGPDATQDCVARASAEIAAGGAERVLDRLTNQPPDLRETAIAMALFVAAADGTFCDQEHEVLASLAIRLDVSPERYNAIADVITVLYRA
ncbi:Tellurite resistance protein TerB [Jannaschia aquimarina]|uniref:Tellurite resistance protein TerB n=2 Tax=Jannaschia aquimarina TaxID=935700 RepID=A0A0D1CIY1_9RHOB|nr:tellurite resistance TerB family protein [Jannaschia aquimarina]KIT14677.1 Tellurite resistance protein TerB [Jannaschia aquimarina]SNT38026.1 Tellurite resistance protein [Jannaschia aquimarina]